MHWRSHEGVVLSGLFAIEGFGNHEFEVSGGMMHHEGVS